MPKRPIEIKAPEEEPSEVVERMIRDAANEKFYEAVGKSFHSFKNKWNDGEIDIPGVSKRLSPEEAAIAIAGKAQEARDYWKAKAEKAEQENMGLRKDNALLQRRNARYEKQEEE